MLGLLLTLHIIVSVCLAAVVLLQRSEGGALGMGGGPTGFMTARGAGDLLSRTTWILGTAFFVLSLALTLVTGREKAASSVVDRVKIEGLSADALKARETQAPAPAGSAPAPGSPAPGSPAPGVPAGGAPAGAAPAPFEAPRPSIANPFGTVPAQPASPAAPPPGR